MCLFHLSFYEKQWLIFNPHHFKCWPENGIVSHSMKGTLTIYFPANLKTFSHILHLIPVCGIAQDCRSDQFTCDNGECIPGHLQCSGKTECSDGSDEKLCRKCTYYLFFPIYLPISLKIGNISSWPVGYVLKIKRYCWKTI